MKACPQCKKQFSDTDEFCPEHGARLIEMSVAVEARGGGQPQIIVRQRDPLIGQSLDGRYTLEEKLGEGGMGVVYRAQHTVIEKTVAVKVLRREVARDASLVQRFLQEAKAASRIGHPNIVDVTDFGTLADGSAYFVMEYIGGKTLSRVLKDATRLQPSRALPIVVQLGRALSAAHEKGVVHRDLKPENIFLIDRDGRRDFVKIVDFGIAKMAPSDGGMQKSGPRLTRVGSVFGTPEYMAPEQAAGRADTDHRVDVYALGTIFYEMLVGNVPHHGETLVATIAMQMLDPIIPPREAKPDLDIDDPLEQVIMKALAKEREARYESMFEFLTALEHAAGGIPLDAMSSTGSVRAIAASSVPSVGTGTASGGSGGGGGTIKSAPDAATLTPAAVVTPRRGINPALVQTAPAMQAPTLVPPVPRAPTNEPPPAAPSGKKAALIVDDAAQSRRFDDEEPIERRHGAGTSRRYLWAAAIVGILAVAGVAIAIVVGGGVTNGGGGGAAGHAGLSPVDAGTGALGKLALAPDAAATIAQSGGHDAGVIAAIEKPDAGAKIVIHTPPPPVVKVRVIVHTAPSGGELYMGPNRAGGDGTTFERPKGTKLDLRCTGASADPGHVVVVFDDKTHDVTCAMKTYHCTPGIKDPLHDCP